MSNQFKHRTISIYGQRKLYSGWHHMYIIQSTYLIIVQFLSA